MATVTASARKPSHAKLTLFARNELTTFMFARTTMPIRRWQTTREGEAFSISFLIGY